MINKRLIRGKVEEGLSVIEKRITPQRVKRLRCNVFNAVFFSAPTPQTTRRGRFTITNVDVNVCLEAYQDVTSPEYRELADKLRKEV